MVELSTFRAWHPAPGARADELVSPVYDTIAPEEYARLARWPANAANFSSRPPTLPLAEFLATAPRTLREAIASRAYVRDPVPSFYVYGIRFVPSEDLLECLPADHRRREYLLLGLVGRLDLGRQAPGSVAVHELTFEDRVAERVELTRATDTQFAPVMAGYSRPTHALNDRLEAALGLHRRHLEFAGSVEPIVEARLGETVHRLWRLTEPDLLRELQELLRPVRLLVLDGHHRYAAARELLARGLPGAAPPAMLVESRDRALQLLPWHRALPRGAVSLEALERRVPGASLACERLPGAATAESVLEQLSEMTRHRWRGFVVVDGPNAARFTGPSTDDGGADFDLLHGYLSSAFGIDPHRFVPFRSPRRTLAAVRERGGPLSGGTAYLLPRLHLEAVEERAFSTGRVMAHKSTMFLPKVAEGVLFATASEPTDGRGAGTVP